VLSHRLVLTFDAVAEGIDPRQIIDYLVAVVPQPQIAPNDESLEQAVRPVIGIEQFSTLPAEP